MKTLLLLLTLAIPNTAYCATAYFTGKQTMVQTVTYQMAWECEYKYLGNTFHRVFKNNCPSSIEVY